MLSSFQFFVIPWIVAHQTPLSMGILQARNTGVVSHDLLPGIFPTQGLNPGLLHCRQILYRLSHQQSPRSHAKSVIPVKDSFKNWCLLYFDLIPGKVMGRGNKRNFPGLSLPLSLPTSNAIRTLIMVICVLLSKKYQIWGPTSSQTLTNFLTRSSSSNVELA